VIDDFVEAKAVADWSTVVAVRMGVLLRSTEALGPGLDVAASAPVNGVAITYPGGTKYDRRVFTTTVALRNRISYF
jgi:type IV pilus assembly protein PilW